MRVIKGKICALLAVAVIFAGVGTASAGINLPGILRDGALIIGGGAAVSLLSDQINDFINTITLNRGAKFDGYTKVVPILSLGSNTRIGAAQIGANTEEAMERTQAVAQLELEFAGVRISVLVPIDSLNPVQQFRRVQGVGVTAIIDVKL